MYIDVQNMIDISINTYAMVYIFKIWRLSIRLRIYIHEYVIYVYSVHDYTKPNGTRWYWWKCVRCISFYHSHVRLYSSFSYRMTEIENWNIISTNLFLRIFEWLYFYSRLFIFLIPLIQFVTFFHIIISWLWLMT